MGRFFIWAVLRYVNHVTSALCGNGHEIVIGVK